MKSYTLKNKRDNKLSISFSFDQAAQLFEGQDGKRVEEMVSLSLKDGYVGGRVPCTSHEIARPLTEEMVGAVLDIYFEIDGALPYPEIENDEDEDAPPSNAVY